MKKINIHSHKFNFESFFLCAFHRTSSERPIDRSDEKQNGSEPGGASHQLLPERQVGHPQRADLPDVDKLISTFWPPHRQASSGAENRSVINPNPKFRTTSRIPKGTLNFAAPQLKYLCHAGPFSKILFWHYWPLLNGNVTRKRAGRRGKTCSKWPETGSQTKDNRVWLSAPAACPPPTEPLGLFFSFTTL